MTVAVFAAVLFAAGLHARWNAVLKGAASDRLWTITKLRTVIARLDRAIQ